MLRPRLHRILDRFALLCFHRSPVDVEALNAYIDNIAGLDAYLERIARIDP